MTPGAAERDPATVLTHTELSTNAYASGSFCPRRPEPSQDPSEVARGPVDFLRPPTAGGCGHRTESHYRKC